MRVADPKLQAAVLDAALDVFVRRGLGAATIEEIRERSGASIGSIYHHFGSKELLAEALYSGFLVEYRQRTLEAVTAHEEAKAGISAIVDAHLDWITANPKRAEFVLMIRSVEMKPRARARLRGSSQEFLQGVTEWFRPRVASGALRRLPPEAFGALIVGPANELLSHWFGEGYRAAALRREVEKARPILRDAAWRAVGGAGR